MHFVISLCLLPLAYGTRKSPLLILVMSLYIKLSIKHQSLSLQNGCRQRSPSHKYWRTTLFIKNPCGTTFWNKPVAWINQCTCSRCSIAKSISCTQGPNRVIDKRISKHDQHCLYSGPFCYCFSNQCKIRRLGRNPTSICLMVYKNSKQHIPLSAI